MLKMIHCADIHLGSKIEAKLPKAKAEERRGELRATFQRMVDYAKREGVRAILLSGDVFDSDRPLKRDKEFFYDVVKGNPEIDFLYLRGNHDGEESYVEEGLKNLKTFLGEWSAYTYEDVTVSGLEMSKENALSFYTTLRLNEEKINVVLLHGQTATATGVDKIHLGKLADKHIDYLALGHIHSYEEGKLDDRGRYAYSGCLEGRGFDEMGEKGFVLLEIDGSINTRFVPFAKRTIHEVTVDVSDTDTSYAAYQKVKKTVEFSLDNLYRINLIGEISYDNERLAEDTENLLSSLCYFVSVKDKTLRKFNVEDYAGDVSLRGEFIRSVSSRSDWSEERKQKVIALGLKALSAREVE